MSGERMTYDSTSDVGVMVWPLFKMFLASDYTLTTLAAEIGHSRRQLRNAFWNPGNQGMRIYGALAYALCPKGTYLKFNMYPIDDYSHMFSKAAPK